jgi:hypothetical protein
MNDSTEHTGKGRFVEEYECVNGHKGWVKGEESAPAESWTRTGTVFNA